MPTVIYREANGTLHRIQAKPGRTLMQIAVEHGVPGIFGDCGGHCTCATCHGYVEESWIARLPPPAETEASMLEAVDVRLAGSRLCCQIRMQDDLDGIVVELPAEQI